MQNLGVFGMAPASLYALYVLNPQAALCRPQFTQHPGVHPAQHNPQDPACTQVSQNQINTDHHTTACGN